jgi:hypothetical protein
VEGDCYFCFKEFFLLFTACHILSVSKRIDIVKL